MNKQKLSKSLLKEIVKECLVELLFEGIDSDRLSEAVSKPRGSSRSLQEAVDERSFQGTERQTTNTRRSTPIPQEAHISTRAQQAIPGLTNDPIMAEIFADTARTTLVEQTGAESRGSRQPATPEAARVAEVDNIEDLFSGAGDWAAIAFANQKK